MSTHNICFCGEIRKIFIWYPLLSRPLLLSCVDAWAQTSLCIDMYYNDLWYWVTLAPYHTCPKILAYPFDYMCIVSIGIDVSKNCWWVVNSVDPDQILPNVVNSVDPDQMMPNGSDLGIHSLLRSVWIFKINTVKCFFCYLRLATSLLTRVWSVLFS